MSRGPRTTIEKDIYQDSAGYAAVARVGKARKEQRFAPETPLKEIRLWLGRTRAELADQQPAEKRGTLTRDADRYYGRIEGVLASWREIRSMIRAWVTLYGTSPRAKIGREQVLAARLVWLKEGLAPKTINHRVNALRAMYRELDGKRCPSPCDEITPLEVPDAPIRLVSPERIRTVYLNLLEHERKGWLRDKQTRARYMVMMASGVRASELMRAEPTDVDLEKRTWRTRDGKGGLRPGGLYLHDELLEAWTLFVAAGAWGPFETSSFSRVLHNCGWPADVRVYNARHSVGVALSEAGADLADVGAYLGHKRSETTRKHYVPILSGRMRALGESLEGRLDWSEPPAQETRKVAPQGGTPVTG